MKIGFLNVLYSGIRAQYEMSDVESNQKDSFHFQNANHGLDSTEFKILSNQVSIKKKSQD